MLIRLRNTGTRPAANALISFTAGGDFHIKPIVPSDEKKQTYTPRFKRPPVAPTGTWREKPNAAFDYFKRLNEDVLRAPRFDNHALYSMHKPNKRDDERFYFKPLQPDTPVADFSLECVRWRHQVSPESFHVELFVKLKVGEFKGALDVSVHASNKTHHFNQQIPFHIEIIPGDTLKEANKLVEELLKPISYGLSTGLGTAE